LRETHTTVKEESKSMLAITKNKIKIIYRLDIIFLYLFCGKTSEKSSFFFASLFPNAALTNVTALFNANNEYIEMH
jgi:hypothetical protein